MLTKSQIRFLKSQAHALHPVVMLGQSGLTEAVHKEIHLALNSHELIKIKLGPLEDAEQEQLIADICQKQGADFVQKLGHIATFYRPNPEKKRFSLPQD